VRQSIFSSNVLTISGDGIYCGVLHVVSAKVPILNVIDRGTGVECDISVENKDGMTRSMIFKFVSSLDERFQILSYLVMYISLSSFDHFPSVTCQCLGLMSKAPTAISYYFSIYYAGQDLGQDT
jgi:hypothetical protein